MTKDQFTQITDWQDKTFPNSTALSKIAHLKQEVQELESDIRSDNKDRRLEYADCFILLFGAAKCDGMGYYDIIACINEKMAINAQRRWGSPDENGVVNHIK